MPGRPQCEPAALGSLSGSVSGTDPGERRGDLPPHWAKMVGERDRCTGAGQAHSLLWLRLCLALAGAVGSGAVPCRPCRQPSASRERLRWRHRSREPPHPVGPRGKTEWAISV